MLDKLRLESFKCFAKLQLPLAPLTLLSGLNASGKSSVLQALTLLHQTISSSERSTALLLNGSEVALGSVSDVVDRIGGRRAFSIGLDSAGYECTWALRADDNDSLTVPIEQMTWYDAERGEPVEVRPFEGDLRLDQLFPQGVLNDSPAARQIADTLTHMTYLSAERIGPRETYPLATSNAQFSVGSHGEYAPWYLHAFGERRPLDSLLIEGETAVLKRQVNVWMSRFFPNAQVEVQPVRNANLVRLTVSTNTAVGFTRPQNVGFGLTNILPIIVACLGAREGDLILIENPESHLHPAGQSLMGQFLARVAAAGIQVVLETHSDHVLNGVRRVVKDGRLLPEQVVIHFFVPRDESGTRAQVTSPLIDPNGTLSEWPSDFFDQFDKDLSALIDW